MAVDEPAVAQFADPVVSRAKFKRELTEYHRLAPEYERRGWFLIEDKFPKVVVVMAASALNPPAIVFGVAFDYTNYDALPPSVRFVNPFTREPYLGSNLPTTLPRSLPVQTMQIPGLPNGGLQMRPAQPLLQFHHPDDLPFLCIAGVREYHDHPGHSGDLWELHRAAGAGRLVRLLDIIHRYGIAPIVGFNVQLIPQVQLQFGEPPQ